MVSGALADIADDLAVGDLLDSIDVLVDGPFVESRKSLELKWCGSSNQRLIDVPATRRAALSWNGSPPRSRWRSPPTGRRAPFGAMTDKSFHIFGHHFFGNLCHPMGSRTVKRVPTSSSLSTDTSPPW